jgi:hypothetical protein
MPDVASSSLVASFETLWTSLYNQNMAMPALEGTKPGLAATSPSSPCGGMKLVYSKCHIHHVAGINLRFWLGGVLVLVMVVGATLVLIAAVAIYKNVSA